MIAEEVEGAEKSEIKLELGMPWDDVRKCKNIKLNALCILITHSLPVFGY